MKLLSQTKNKHFYFGYEGCLYNTSKENCLMHIEEKHLPQLSIEESVKFYPSGALVTIKNSNKIKLIFINNDGERLVDFDTDKLNKPVKNLDAFVCSTGVYLALTYMDNDSCFEYHTYKGGVLMSFDESKLDKKIEKYEQVLGIYEDNFELSKKKKPFTNQILEALNQSEDGETF